MIIKYIIGVSVGWIIGSSMLINVLTILRFGIPMCNVLLKNKEDDERALKNLRNRYCLSLIICSIITIIITWLCYKFLNNGFKGYTFAIIVSIILGFNTTGNNTNNMADFYNSLQNQIRRLS